VSPPSDQDNRPQGADAPAGLPTAQPTDALDLVLPAEWVAPSIARDRIRQWLRAHRWSPAHLDDLVLAVSEAISNSVEHGYDISAEGMLDAMAAPVGTIELHGRLITDPAGPRRVEFTVRDYGRWTPPPATPGNRGHGLTLMRAGTDEVTIDHTPAGTTITLRSRPLPRPPRRTV
jgi:anti-sigma regulatory factor (Ser/Thr protein kinase)